MRFSPDRDHCCVGRNMSVGMRWEDDRGVIISVHACDGVMVTVTTQ